MHSTITKVLHPYQCYAPLKLCMQGRGNMMMILVCFYTVQSVVWLPTNVYSQYVYKVTEDEESVEMIMSIHFGERAGLVTFAGGREADSIVKNLPWPWYSYAYTKHPKICVHYKKVNREVNMCIAILSEKCTQTTNCSSDHTRGDVDCTVTSKCQISTKRMDLVTRFHQHSCSKGLGHYAGGLSDPHYASLWLYRWRQGMTMMRTQSKNSVCIVTSVHVYTLHDFPSSFLDFIFPVKHW